MTSCSLLLAVILIEYGGLTSSIAINNLSATPAARTEAYVPSHIIVNYLSKYFNKSDRFVKMWLSSMDTDQAHLQLDIVDTVIQSGQLSGFTFELITNAVDAREHRLMYDSSPNIGRTPFDLFIIDSIESFK